MRNTACSSCLKILFLLNDLEFIEYPDPSQAISFKIVESTYFRLSPVEYPWSLCYYPLIKISCVSLKLQI